MAGDDEILEGAPPPRRPLPKRVRGSIVIEGQATREPSSFATFARALPWAAAIAALALGGLWIYLNLPDLAPTERRIAELDVRDDALAVRLQKAESSLAAAKAAASARADEAARADAARDSRVADGALAESAAVVSLARRLDEAAKTIKALQARLYQFDPDELARRLAAADTERVDLQSRLDRIEAALAAPNADMRAPSGVADKRPAALAAAALALRQRLKSGAPLAAELQALDQLGVDAAALAPLRRFADKAGPTTAELVVSLRELAPQMQGGDAPPAARAAERPRGAARGVENIGEVGESGVKDSVVAEIEAALARDDLAAALAAARDLPRPDADWVAALQSRREAEDAAQALVDAAQGGLGR